MMRVNNHRSGSQFGAALWTTVWFAITTVGFTNPAVAQQPSASQSLAIQSPTTLGLMPVPRTLSVRSGQVRIEADFRVAVIGHSDARLVAAVNRMIPRLERRTGLALSRIIGRSVRGGTLLIYCAGSGERVQSVNEDESYSIDADSGVVNLRATTTVGAMRGLETVLQLVQGDSVGFFVPAVTIQDSPRFRWRGLLVDVSRHFEPVESVQRTLDGMAAVKLNVLHWHLSDDQGFRVESHRYPRLQRLGSDGQYYTQTQVRAIVAYARARGIRVIPEFDMPGHATSWFAAYPQYASAPGPYRLGVTWSGHTATFDPTRERVYRFIDNFIGEMATLFPDAYWHIGGDEVVGKQWNENPRIQSFMRAHQLANNAALQAYFNQRLSAILTWHGKRMIGWDEVLHPDLPKTTVVQSWRGTKYLDQAVRAGFSGILSAPYYLDAMKSAETHYLADPLPSVPADSALMPEESARVLGGEACMWAELVNPETIDSRIWPRTAAIAERFWSPRQVADVADMYRRLAIESVQLEQLGLTHEVTQARLLRNIVDAPDIAALTELLRFAEPVTLGQRVRAQHPTTLTPYVQLVDAARPDPPSRFELQQLVAAALADSVPGHVLATQGSLPAGDVLRSLFTSWAPLSYRILRDGDVSTARASALRAALALRDIGIIGLAALDARTRGVPLPPSWIEAALVTLRADDQPQGLLHLTPVPAVHALLVAPMPLSTTPTP